MKILEYAVLGEPEPSDCGIAIEATRNCLTPGEDDPAVVLPGLIDHIHTIINSKE